MLEEKALKDAALKVLALAKKVDPKAEALVSVSSNHGAHIRFARNTVTTTGDIDQPQLALSVRLGQRAAGATTNQIDASALAGVAERAVGMARLAPEDPEAMPVLGPQKYSKTPALDPAVASLDAAARAALVRAALDAGKEAKLDVAGFLFHNTGVAVRATTAGLYCAAPHTEIYTSVTARTSDGSGSGWANLETRKRAELDLGKLARVACAKAAASAKAIALEPGRYTVVLEPAATLSIVEPVVGALDLRAADEGRSAFTKPGGGTRVGEKLFGELINIVGNPASPDAAMLPFDGEGMALSPRTWVEKGVLKQFSVGRFWAKKKGVQPTGGYSGFELLPGTSTREELIRGVKRGVLITRFWYTNTIDPKTLALTGLTRDGTFLIEDGQVTRPVNNFRFNQSSIDALLKCDALSADTGTAWSPDIRAPAMRTHEFLLASKSDAV
jgi:predicted Zn-dependent protease